MPKSEDLALASFATIGAVTYGLKRSGFFFSRIRVTCFTAIFCLWQRYLASGCTTWSGYSNFYPITRSPDDESHYDDLYPGQGRLLGKTVVVTGVTPPDNGINAVTNSPGSIGFYTAVELFRMGATVIMTSRGDVGDSGRNQVSNTTDPVKSVSSINVYDDKAAQALKKRGFTDSNRTFNDQEVIGAVIRECRLRVELSGMYQSMHRLRVVHLDLEDSDIEAAIDKCAKEIEDTLDEIAVSKSTVGTGTQRKQIDILINGLGALYPMVTGSGEAAGTVPPRHPMGLEKHVAVNAIGPILLTERLKPKITKGTGRIIHLTCDAHRQIKDVNEAKNLLQGRAVSRSQQSYYAASKLVNLCYAVEQQQSDPDHIHVALHPGVSLTNLYKTTPGWKFFRDFKLEDWVDGLCTLVFKSPKEASHTSIHCCVDHRIPAQVGKSTVKKGGVEDSGENKNNVFYYVDCRPGNKYASHIVKDEKMRKETMEAVNSLIENALGKKRKLALREAAVSNS